MLRLVPYSLPPKRSQAEEHGNADAAEDPQRRRIDQCCHPTRGNEVVGIQSEQCATCQEGYAQSSDSLEPRSLLQLVRAHQGESDRHGESDDDQRAHEGGKQQDNAVDAHTINFSLVGEGTTEGKPRLCYYNTYVIKCQSRIKSRPAKTGRCEYLRLRGTIYRYRRCRMVEHTNLDSVCLCLQ